MQIVLEGPDNAGKTTLAAYLSEALGIPVVHSGGPSKYPGEVNERSRTFNASDADRIYDRHPCVSQNIYQDALATGGERVSGDLIGEFYEQRPFIIYCRSRGTLDGHEMSEHSDDSYFRQVASHYFGLCQLYDDWALTRANLIYRIGDNMKDVANTIGAIYYGREDGSVVNVDGGAAFNPWQDIIDFHTKFGQEYVGLPRQLEKGLSQFRRKFIREEAEEYDAAVDNGHLELLIGGDEAGFVNQLELQFDALIDLTYVTLGAAYLQGFNFPEGWRRVHHANMQKVRAERRDGTHEIDVVDSGRDKRYDIVKPKGWEAPKHTDLIENHAHVSTFALDRAKG